MNKLIALLLIFSQTAFAGLPPTAVQGQSDTSPQTKFNFQVPYSQKTDLGGVKALFETGNKNLLANPSFEHTTATTSWTTTKLTGTTFTSAADTTNFSDGKKSLLGTLTAATGEISQDVTPSIQTNGVPMVAACRVLTTGTDVQVCARTNATDIQCNTVASAGNWVLQAVNFTGPANGTSVGVSVKNTTSNTETFNVDDCYVGVSSTAQNFGQVSQASLVGTIKITGCSGAYTTSSTTLATFGACSGGTYAATGSALAPTTNLLAIRFASLPPGDYLLKYEGDMTNITAGKNGYLQFTDGTNTAREVSTFGPTASSPGISQTISYATAQSNVTLEIFGKSDSGGTTDVWGTTTVPGVISVYRFPTSSEQAYRPDVLPANWSGYDDSISGGCSSASATYADPSACTNIALHQINSQNLSCVAAASSAPAITCTFNKIGLYELSGFAVLSWSGAGGRGGIRLVDGSGTVVSPGTTMGNASTSQTHPFDGLYNVTSTGSVTFKVQISNNNGNTINIDQGPGTSGNAAIEWNVKAVGQGTNAPLLAGSVLSNSTGQEHTERANFTCSSSSAINSQSGSWASSIGNIASGKCSVTVTAGEWSATPSCPTDRTGTAVTRVSCHANPTSSTNVDLYCVTDAGAADTSCTCDTICMGPR